MEPSLDRDTAATKQAGRKQSQRIIALAIFLLGLTLIAVALWGIWPDWRDDLAARREYSGLRKDFTPPGDMSRFLAINPDFVAWLTIPGTRVSYPVVHGQDNLKYLKTTFRGKSNPAGAIFMDYRIKQPFAAPVNVVYGHNMRDGSMFATLNKYLDSEFFTEHPEIIVYTLGGEVLNYQVFEARRISAKDPLFSLDFNDTNSLEYFGYLFEVSTDVTGSTGGVGKHILVLSTCSDGRDNNARTVVFAQRITAE